MKIEGILLVTICLLLASCSMRYGHIPKVKGGNKKQVATHKKPRLKQKIVLGYIEPKKLFIIESGFSFPPIKPVTLSLALLKEPAIHDMDASAMANPPAVTDTTNTRPLVIPERKDMRLNNSNFAVVFNVFLVIAVAALLILSSVVAFSVLSDFLFFGALPAAFVLLGLGFGTGNTLIILLLRYLVRRSSRIKTRYNGVTYTQEEIRGMPAKQRTKHALNNFYMSLALLAVTLPFLVLPELFILTLGFGLSALYFLFRAITIH